MKEEILKQMHEICAQYSYEPTSFMEKIANAKLRMFGMEEWKRCPCDDKNPNRSCISEQCHKDIEEKGRCHCNCYSKPGHGESKAAE